MVCRRLLALAALIWSSPAVGQYTPPGTTGPSSDIPTGESLRAKYENARWHAGPFALEPWLGLRDGTFVTDDGEGGGERREDFTITAGAGLRAYLRLGPKLVLAGQALPEYVYWTDDADRRQWNGRLGLGLFADFNRLAVEVSTKRVEEQSFFSPEILSLASGRSNRSRVAIELAPRRRISLAAAIEHRESRSEAPDDEADLRLLDHDADRIQATLLLRPRSKLRLGLGVERGETTFLAASRNLSGSEDAVIGQLAYEGGRLGVSFAAARRSLDPDPGSSLPQRDETTGDLQARWAITHRVGLLGYLRRDLVYSIRDETAYLSSQRLGFRLELGVPAATVGFVFETGSDDVRPIGVAAPRTDDALAYGAELRFTFRRSTQLAVGAFHTEIDSPIDAFDREVTTVRTSFQIGLSGERLRIGEPPGEW